LRNQAGSREATELSIPTSIPNIITLGRIILVPVIVWAIASSQMEIAFAIFIVAGVSDAVDGFLAKRFNMASELGALLDPLADKALLVSIYVALGIWGAVPRWIVILVVSRDIMIVSAVIVSWLFDKPVEMKPLMVSKLNTVAQVAFAALVLASLGFGFQPHRRLQMLSRCLQVTLALIGSCNPKLRRGMERKGRQRLVELGDGFVVSLQLRQHVTDKIVPVRLRTQFGDVSKSSGAFLGLARILVHKSEVVPGPRILGPFAGCLLQSRLSGFQFLLTEQRNSEIEPRDAEF